MILVIISVSFTSHCIVTFVNYYTVAMSLYKLAGIIEKDIDDLGNRDFILCHSFFLTLF